MNAEQENKTTPVTVEEPSSVESLMQTLILDAGELQNMYKQWFSTVKKLSVEMKKEKKKMSKKKTKRKVNQKPQKVSNAMRKFMKKYCENTEVDHSLGAYTRQSMMKTVSSYIKSKNIQNQENKKQWSGKEKKLKSLFGLKQEWYTFMQINGLLSRVISKE